MQTISSNSHWKLCKQGTERICIQNKNIKTKNKGKTDSTQNTKEISILTTNNTEVKYLIKFLTSDNMKVQVK